MPELKIIISAENQKALTELTQLQDKLFQLQETVKNYKGDWPLTTIIETKIPAIQARITELQGSLTKAGVAFDNFGNDTKKIEVGSNRAGLALNDLSRIAQDAPYGFIGISNNLNPMVESFGRLVEKEKGVKNALASMVSSLTGPAGIGLAIGVVSSILVVFSKQITEAFGNSADKLKTFREELNKLNAEIYKIAGVEQANLAKGNFLVDTITGKGDAASKTNAINELKKLYNYSKEIQDIDVNNQKNYSKELLTQYVNRAAAQNFAIGSEKNNLDALKLSESKYKDLQDKIKQEQEAITKPLYTTTSEGKQIILKTIKGQQDDIVKGYKKSIDEAKADIALYSSKEGGLLGSVLGFKTPDKKSTTTTDNSLQDSFKEIIGEGFASERLKRSMKGQSLSLIFLDTPEGVVAKERKRIESIKTLLKPIVDEMASETGFGGMLGKMAARDAPKFIAEDDEKKRQGTQTIKAIKDQEQAYKQFANTISNEVTGALMNMWDVMQHGENPLRALGDMLMKLVENLVALAIQAGITVAILSLLPGSDVAVAAQGGQAATGFFDIFKMLLGVKPHAQGGITTGPSMGLIGEAGPEAIMPLSKLSSFLNTSFNAGAMNGSSTGNGGQFVLRGQDLLVALNRTQKASNLKGQSISLA